MEKSRCHIMLIDDHPVITEVFVDMLKQIGRDQNLFFYLQAVHTIDHALYLLDRVSPLHPMDMVFLDIRLPPSVPTGILSGEDLGLKIRQTQPKTKIVVVIMYNDHHRIRNIIRHFNPEGFWLRITLPLESFT